MEETFKIKHREKNKVILFIDHDQGYSGSTVSLIYLLKYFYLDGYKLVVLTSKTDERFLKPLEPFCDEIIKINRNYNLGLHIASANDIFSLKGLYSVFLLFVRIPAGICRGFHILLRTKPDLVYINEYVVLQFNVVARVLGIPTVTHIRSPILKGRFGIRNHLLKKSIIYFSNLVVAISKTDALLIDEKLKKIIVIYEFVDDEDYKSDYPNSVLRKELGINDNAMVLLMMGGISAIKGTLDFLKALSCQELRRKNFFAIIIGPIDKSDSKAKKYYQECMKQINNSIPGDKISIIHHSVNTKSYLEISDVVISSNTTSHFSRPVIEAWAKCKPVVSSATKQATEFIEENQEGLLYNIGDYKDLANKLAELVENREKCNYLGENGKLKVLKFFNANENVNKIITAINRLLKKNN